MIEATNRLREILAEKHISHTQLAKQIGVSQSTVSKWCTNTSQPVLSNLLKLTRTLGVGIEAIVLMQEEV